ncbi:hypothetical protein VP01_4637g2, partial [Puccinia sorghi]
LHSGVLESPAGNQRRRPVASSMWLNNKYNRHCDKVRQACIALEKTAQTNAWDDFYDWLDHASPFQDISNIIWLKHCEGEEAKQLRNRISISSQADLHTIINLASHPPKRAAPNVIQLDAMGSAPSTKCILRQVFSILHGASVCSAQIIKPLNINI